MLINIQPTSTCIIHVNLLGTFLFVDDDVMAQEYCQHFNSWCLIFKNRVHYHITIQIAETVRKAHTARKV